jgi:hypothetical protein
MMLLVGSYLSYAAARRIFPVGVRALKSGPKESEQRPDTYSDMGHKTPPTNRIAWADRADEIAG